ncbi:MAG: MBL fold metallo-hydrolase, partial [Acidimicrobiia bacterium]
MPEMSRRLFLGSSGRAAFAVAMLGLAACGDDDAAPATTAAAAVTTTAAATTSSTSSSPTSSAPTTEPVAGEAPAAGVEWRRVSLGFVSAYVLARGGEAAIVDTGVAGSGGDIAAGLASLGLGWGDVGHVVFTHLHGDHIGSSAEVMTSAVDAVGYAGAPDLPAVESPRPITAVDDGDRVFDLEVIATPGHTAGHISVLDPVGGVLVAGDAINGQDGGVTGPNPQFSSDMTAAIASVAKLATFTFDTVLCGHGDPVLARPGREL